MKNVIYYNAGAGSGKTYKQTHVLAQRIREGLNPGEVILTTFTNAAATDFKERARAVLYEEGLHEEAAMLDQAIIGTVHSVGEYFIKRYWYLLGLSPEMNVMDEDSTKFYINQSLAALPTAEDIQLFRKFRKAFSLTHEEKGIQGRPYEMFWKDWLSDVIEKAVAYRVENKEHSEAYSLNLIEKIFKPNHDFDLTPDRFLSVLKDIERIAMSESSAAAEKRVIEINDFLNKRTWGMEDFIALGIFLKGLPKGYGKKVPDLPNLTAEIAGIWHCRQVYELIVAVVQRIYAMADEWREQYKLYKQERRIIDFNDMEYYFLELLKRPEIATEISGRYKCLMVDEFQDSSPVQVDIFNHLSELVEESYWCGDSKQAIYGFRGADTDLTEAVVNMIPVDKLESLDTSYRSEPAIVNLCNSVFTRAFAGKLDADKVVLKEHREKESEGPNLIHWKSSYKSKEHFIASIAPHIEKLIKEQHIPCRDIAVLAYSNNDLNILSNALDNIGIPVNHGTGLLNEQKETELMMAILTLLVDGHNLLAKAKTVFLTEQGWKLKKLIDDRLQDMANYKQYLQRLEAGEAIPEEEVPMEWLNDQPLIKLILSHRKEWMSQSVSSQVESVLVELNLRSVMKSWGFGWEQRESNLYQIVDLAKKYEQYCLTMTLGATTTGFLDYLSTTDAPSAGDSEGVVLSTYHGSKGLQWKNVILLSLDRNVVDDKKILQQSIFGIHKIRTAEPTQDNLFPEMIISLIPWPWGKSKAPDDIASEITDSESFVAAKRIALEESARLLYVGMTRAQDRLITTSKAEKTVQKAMTWIDNLGITLADFPETGEVDLFGSGLSFTLGEATSMEEPETEAPQIIYKDIDMSKLKTHDYPDKYIAPSHTDQQTQGKVELAANRGERIPLRGNPEMSEVGTCIHNIYAACTGNEAHDVQMAQRMISSFHFEKVLPDAHAIIAARQYLIQWLTDKFGISILEHHELAFMHEVENQIVRGSMDFVWETKKGCVLIDFKTFPGTESVVTEEDNLHFAGNYKPQFDCYRTALEAAGKQVIAQYVYYPVNGMIVSLK